MVKKVWGFGAMMSAIGLAAVAGAAPAPPSATSAAITPANIPPGTGVAGLYCRRAPSGIVSDCRVGEEFPLGVGVGEAAIKSADGSNVAGTAKVETVVHISVKVPLTPEQTTMTPVPGPPLVMTSSQWVKKPMPGQVMSAYPARAIEAGVGGSAILSCRVTKTGTLYSCIVVSYAPVSDKFDAAALMLAKAITLPVQSRAGEPIEWTVLLPMKFIPLQSPGGYPQVN